MLGDLHIHMVLDGRDWRAAIAAHEAGPVESLIRARLADYADRGIRFLRDGGDRWGVALRARSLARDYGIDYRTPAFPIYKKGHYGGFIGRGFETMAEYEALLEEARGRRACFCKVMISGLIDFDHYGRLTGPGPEAACITEMVARAKARGFAVMAHANGDHAVQAALKAGVDSVEHGAYLSRQTVEAMAEAGVVWVPTLSALANPIGTGRNNDQALIRLVEEQAEKLNYFAALGGLVGLGSDAGAWRVGHEIAAQTEYRYLQAILGSKADQILAAGEEKIKETFKPQG